MSSGLEQVGARSGRGGSAWSRAWRGLDSLSFAQLLVLLAAAAALLWLALATRKPVHRPYVLDAGAGKKEKAQFVLEACEIAPSADWEENWKWCHGGHYKVCKANYAANLKLRDFKTLLETVARAFDRYDVRWWLDFTTLQGVAVQSGELFPWEHSVTIGVLQEDFEKYYEKVIGRVHDCSDDEKPVFWSPYTSSSLKGKFEMKREPRFWLDVSPWKTVAGEGGDMLVKAAWKRGASHPEVVDVPRREVLPLLPIKVLGVQCFIPAETGLVLDRRYGEQWRQPEAPDYYRPDLVWGSAEMRKL